MSGRWAARLQDDRGAVLVEFALVAFVLYLVLTAAVELGRLVFAAQLTADAARVAARELALVPLAAELTFEEALAEPGVRARVFDPAHLVVDLDAHAGEGALDAYFATLPVVNRMLRPAMIAETVTVEGTTCRLLRYPGALLRVAGGAGCSGLTVGVPRVVARDGTGAETLEWVPVLEELRQDPGDPSTGPFSLMAATAEPGLVALRINYPYQAAGLTSFRAGPAGPFEPNLQQPNLADDAAVSAPAPPEGTLAGDLGGVGPYAGPYGLGRLYALGTEVRPFRRLVSGQALFRREVFE
jgi:hypothetical protein